jgi:hypothetical protein
MEGFHLLVLGVGRTEIYSAVFKDKYNSIKYYARRRSAAPLYLLRDLTVGAYGVVLVVNADSSVSCNCMI